jgi:hypothetical protein
MPRRDRAGDDGRERDSGCLRIVAGQPKRRDYGTHNRGVELLFAHLGQGGFYTIGLSHPHEDLQEICSHPRIVCVRGMQLCGQRLGGPNRIQRPFWPAPDQLKDGAGPIHIYPGGRLEFYPEGAPSAAEPPLRLLELALANHDAGELSIGDAGDRLLAPTMPLGQLDRLPAQLRAGRIGAEAHGCRAVGQAGELKVGAPDLTS